MASNFKFDSLKSFLKYHLYLKDLAKKNELEIRFGTAKSTRISKIDYDNIIKSLKSNNFTSSNENGNYVLKVSNDVAESHIRAEINGLHYIQDFCKSNSLSKTLKEYPENIGFLEKTPVLFDKNSSTYVPKLDNTEYNFRIAYSEENFVESDNSKVVSFMTNSANNNFYRFINRVTYTHPDFPLKIDCSVVKSNTSRNKTSFQSSKVLESNELYEVEIELNNEAALQMSLDELYAKTQKATSIVLQGLQDNFYPISNSERKNVINEYKSLLKIGADLYPSFCGPSSITLQLHHLQPTHPENILSGFTITDKADGARKMLFVSLSGRIYFVTTNLQIQYTGSSTSDANIFNTLLDGEHILYDKRGEFINLFAAFDCYYVNNKSFRDAPFVIKDKATKDNPVGRYNELTKTIKLLRQTMTSNFVTIITKTFAIPEEPVVDGPGDDPSATSKATPNTSLFSECQKLFTRLESDDHYPYNTDGLIFTPAYLAVGANKPGESAPMPKKLTWKRSFKWKPPEYNTIDFLVTLPTKTSAIMSLGNYKEVHLRIGYNTKQHGMLNPFKTVIDGDFNSDSTSEPYTQNKTYEPALFFPTNPYDSTAHICHIPLILDENNIEQMLTEEKEVFTENTIVEFKYVSTNPVFKRWIPIRVRYDKTYELKTTGKNFGNAYHVANNNWHSIHQPISKELLSTGTFSDIESQDDIYYDQKEKSNIVFAMRKFHNIIKANLIQYASEKFDSPTLIDLAVGKGGDIKKWHNTKNITFVLGIDQSQDNIENKIDGACKRYIDDKKNNPTTPPMIFLYGDSSKNIRDGSSFSNLQHQALSEGLFGAGAKSKSVLGKVVHDHYGIAKDGFDIVSCQFALHYFFKDKLTLKNFIINLVECTKMNGIVIGTCYDGAKVFQMLSDKKSQSFVKNDNIILNIIKKYEYDSFNDDSSSLGYAIEVFQESINRSFVEYLVNFQFFKRVMENYGFVLETVEHKKDDTSNIIRDLPIDSFESLYNNYTSANSKFSMSHEEKQISFLNNYFIFKKVRHVSVSETIFDDGDLYSASEDPALQPTKPVKKILKIKKPTSSRK